MRSDRSLLSLDIVGQPRLVELTSRVAGHAEGAPRALILLGEPGIGKSTLLHHATNRAAAAGIRVLSAAGGDAGAGTPFASLGELLWPIVDLAATLTAPLRDALSVVLGIDEHPAVGPGPALIRQAVLALLRATAERDRLLIALDDADRFDRDSWDVLAYVLPRLAGARVTVLLTARRRDALTGLDGAVPAVDVSPLPIPAALELIARQPRQPAPGVRGEIVRWARGNPLALIEAVRLYARTGATQFRLTEAASRDSAYGVIAAHWADLSDDVRRLLLYAAAGSGYEMVDVITAAAGFGDDVSVWDPAVASGLVTIDRARHIVFCHALARTAAYAESPAAQRRAAHLGIADVLRGDPSARAWQLAAAAVSPDESVAAALEDAAEKSLRRGGYLEVARALQRSGELSGCPDAAAHRYAMAAAAANFGGDIDWALALLDLVVGAHDPLVRGRAAMTTASILIQSARPADAFAVIRSVLNAEQPPGAQMALSLTYLAGNAAYYSGDPDHRRPLRRWLALAERPAVGDDAVALPFPAQAAAYQRAYVEMYAGVGAAKSGRPAAWDRRWLEPGAAVAEPHRLLVTGVMAYASDDSAVAARQLATAIDQLRATGGLRGFTYAMAPLAWALLDTGRWSELAELLEEAQGLSAMRDLELLHGETGACRAVLLAQQGEVDAAAKALSAVPFPASDARATTVAMHRAAGWIALVSNDFDGAFREWRKAFEADGTAVHFVVSPRALADLAWAAARTGRVGEVRTVIARIGRDLGSSPPARLRLLRHQALGLIATTPVAERHFRLAVSDPAGAEWPLERARAMLHYGEWLRRARRPTDARAQLMSARQIFDRLGAVPLLDIAAAELRAAGVGNRAVGRDVLEQLTAQERKIVVLAASGLTNREIGERLNLSPRTIGSHLYHVYPKLGVSRRHELRDIALGNPRQDPPAR